MLFELSAAKKHILLHLVERDWTPTDLAAELDQSTSTVYNHLEDLTDQGILTKETIPAKTRPKNQYSIGTGFIQYVTASPGQFREHTLQLDAHKESIVKIWNIPQADFHPYLEHFWYGLRFSDDIDLTTDITAVGVYGSVARGDADGESDIDVLIITDDDTVNRRIEEGMGSRRINPSGQGAKVVLAEMFTRTKYLDSLAHGSQFLDSIFQDLHVIYDPERLFTGPDT